MIFLYGFMMVIAMLFVIFAYRKHHLPLSDAAFSMGIIMAILIMMLVVVGVLYTANVGRVSEMDRERQYLIDHGRIYEMKRYNDNLARLRALRSSSIWPGFLLYPSTEHLDFIDIVDRKTDEQIKYRKSEEGNSTGWFDITDIPIYQYFEEMW